MLEKSIVLLAALYTLCTILEVLHEKRVYIYIYALWTYSTTEIIIDTHVGGNMANKIVCGDIKCNVRAFRLSEPCSSSCTQSTMLLRLTIRELNVCVSFLFAWMHHVRVVTHSVS